MIRRTALPPSWACWCSHPPASGGAGQIGHAFVIVLENEDANATFRPGSQAPYLADTLTAQGAFVPNCYGIAHNSLPNYLAMVSGQSPTVATQADCPAFTDVLPGLPSSNDQVVGQGCVYPASVNTIAGQLEAKHMTWKGYMEDMGDDPARTAAQAVRIRRSAPPTRPSRRAPRPVRDPPQPIRLLPLGHRPHDNCAARDVSLKPLQSDLASIKSTPNLSFITPDLCHDGHDATCADGGPGGLAAADAFLAPGSRASPPPRLPARRAAATSSTRPPPATRAPAVVAAPPNTPAPGGPSGGRAAGARARCCSRRGTRLER